MKSLSRRAFLKTISQAGLLCAAQSFARAAETLNPGTVTISILHTTDLHGHILPTVDYRGNPDLGGLARCVTQIRRWRQQNRNSILIDVGDVYQGTEVGLRSKGELMIDLFNYLKYDVWIIGNHEFDWGIEPFSRAVARSTMPVLAANTLLEGRPAGEISDTKNPFSKIQPYILKEIAGIKIAIIGVTTPGMLFWFRPEFARGIDFQYPVEPVRRAIQCDDVDFRISRGGCFHSRSYASSGPKSHDQRRAFDPIGPFRHSRRPCRSCLRSQFKKTAPSRSKLRIDGQPFPSRSCGYFPNQSAVGRIRCPPRAADRRFSGNSWRARPSRRAE
ncbi:MAG: hypothetical protein DMF30_09610 [Verrucomicrobia bacterium]|nr:MAG: hypothetical protein DMF30_09610 [Verrucomicrobiota bacterium]